MTLFSLRPLSTLGIPEPPGSRLPSVSKFVPGGTNLQNTEKKANGKQTKNRHPNDTFVNGQRLTSNPKQ